MFRLRRAQMISSNRALENTALFLALVAMPVSAIAFGNDDEWVSGFGQGVCESIVTHGANNSIYVSCECGSGRPSSGITFRLAGQNPTGSSILLTFDGRAPEEISISDGRIESNCRACAATFTYVIELLRTYNSVNVRFENGDNATFTLKGSNSAIGECIADFYR